MDRIAAERMLFNHALTPEFFLYALARGGADATVRVEVAGKKPKAGEIRLGLEKGLEDNNLVVWM